MATKTASLALIRAKLQIVGTDNTILDTELSSLFDEGLIQLAIDKPREAKSSITGNGGTIYPLPSSWVRGSSTLERVEYPGGSSPKEFIDQNHYQTHEVDNSQYGFTGTATESELTLDTASDAIYFKKWMPITISQGSNEETFYLTADGNTSTGVLSLSSALANTYTSGAKVYLNDIVEFLANTPGTAEFFVLHYLGGYTLSDTVDNVPTNLYNALINKNCSIVAYSISAHYGRSMDSTIGADIVNYDGKPTTWREIGDKFDKLYNKAISGGSGDDVRPVAAFVDVDIKTSDDSYFVFHPSSQR